MGCYFLCEQLNFLFVTFVCHELLFSVNIYLLWYLGYGVIAEKVFMKGDYLMEYKGNFIDSKEAARRELVYENQDVGCFMYYFKHAGKTVW